MTPIEFIERVMWYCHATGGSVTSWGRTAARNAAVGGHPQSKHLTWTAADVGWVDGEVPPTGVDRQAFAARFGIQLVIEGDHDHLQVR